MTAATENAARTPNTGPSKTNTSALRSPGEIGGLRRPSFSRGFSKGMGIPFSSALPGGVRLLPVGRKDVPAPDKQATDAETSAARPRQHRVTGYAALETSISS